MSEASIGANVRRIEATTGLNTVARLRAEEALVDAAAGLLKAKPDELPDRIGRLLEERRDLERQIEQLRRAAAVGRAGELAATAVGGAVVQRVDGLSRDGLRDLAVAVRDRGVDAVVLIGVAEGGGVALAAATAPGGRNAGSLIADAAKAVGGGGGKGADLAVAGGRNPDAVDAAVELARAAVTG